MLSIKRRLESAQQREGGFTLIELAVVILIIGILLAIAIPTFLGIRKNAQNKAAQSSLRTVLTAAKAHASDDGSYLGMLAADVQPDEKSITIDNTASAGPKHVTLVVSNDDLVLAAKSQSGTCYLLTDNIGDGTSGVRYAKATSGTCDTTAVQLANFVSDQKAGWK